jgi:hypothetical protein
MAERAEKVRSWYMTRREEEEEVRKAQRWTVSLA